MDESKPHALHEFMHQVSDEIAAEYERIQRRAKEDPGTAGDEGEENWRELLEDWLPSTFTVVTKGRIIGADGRTSPQVDVLVLKGSYPPKLLNKKLYLAAGVAAAFECKTTLKASHIAAAVETGVKIKDLYRVREGTPYRELHAPIVYGLLTHSHSWKSANSTPEQNITESLWIADYQHVVHPRYCLDLICVADLGSWMSKILTFIGPKQIPYQAIPTASDLYGPDGSAQSIFMKYIVDKQGQSKESSSIGSMLSHLVCRLAWEDPTLRDLAEYYVQASLGGSGSGGGRKWPSSIYSQGVRPRVEAGILSNGTRWDEWGLFFH